MEPRPPSSSRSSKVVSVTISSPRRTAKLTSLSIEIFFRCDPCGSRMLHRPTLLSNLNYPPTHPDFPHPALLHAICATSSRFTLRGRLDASMTSLSMSPQGAAPLRDKFAEFHANKTRAYVNQTMSNGQNIFDVFQACMILSWWFYSEGRWVEVWVQAGFQTRAVIPLGLNYLGLVKRGADGAPVKNPYLAPPKSLHETETRRRAWWMSIMFDRIVSVGGWLHSVDERDIGTELPLTSANYEAGVCSLICVQFTKLTLGHRVRCLRIHKLCIQKICTPTIPSTTPIHSSSSSKASCSSVG